MYFIKKLSCLAALFLLLFAMGCQPEKPKSSAEKPAPKKKFFAPEFQRDSAYSFVNQQVAFGFRLPNTSGHKACKEWLVGKFKSYGLKVMEQPFQAKAYTGKTLNGVNIIAQYNPSASKRILLAAHWDTRHIADSPLSTERQDEPILGADDGGSGVGVLLEIARQLQATPTNIGVDFVLFDAEDYGDNASANPKPESWCLGSQHWAKNMMPPNYRPKFGILLDMVGARNAKFPKEGVSLHFAPQVVDKVWRIGQHLGYTRFFDDTKVGTVTDDHLFVNTIAKIPMIDIIGMPRPPDTQNSFGKHWHTHNDNMDIIDAYTLRAVGQTLLEVIYREAAGE
ncbi:MAG TPA: M28 family peptidase [Bacteroidetes bacterium]|nr:M28 family peptidase [Bacteroidota bacterium]